MNGRLSTCAALISLVLASPAWAGLGSIRVQSHLGEKFNAIVPLSKLSAADDVQITIASPSTFQSMNVEYDSILQGFSVSAVETINGQVAVRVRSKQAVNEPYVRLVLEEKSAGGAKSFREYTVLLDPPELRGHSADTFPLNQSTTKPNRYIAQTPTVTSAEQTKAKPTEELPRTLIVKPNQTLMELGRRYRPENATIEETTTAIFRANLHAFYRQDPNRLKVGAKITVPSVSSILASSKPPATRKTPNLPINTLPVTKSATTPQTVTVNATPPVAPQTETATDVATLAQRLEEKERSIRDAEERIKRLEASIEALKSGNPAALGSTNAPPAPQAVSTPVAKPTLTNTQPDKPQLAPVAVMQEPSFLDGIDWTLVGGGVGSLFLLGGTGLWLRARRKKQSEHPNAYDKIIGAKHSKLDRVTQQTEMTQLGGHSFLTNVTHQGFAGLEPAEVDPVAEAEVYMAYGRNEQALDIIKEALMKNPTLLEVRLKSLELYKLLNRPADFEKELQSLHDVLGGVGSMWTRVIELAKDFVPDHPLLKATNLTKAHTTQASHIDAFESDLDFGVSTHSGQSLEDELEDSLLSPNAGSSKNEIPFTPNMTASVIDLETELQQAFVSSPSNKPSVQPNEEKSIVFSKEEPFDLDMILNDGTENSAEAKRASETEEPLMWEPSLLDFPSAKTEKSSTLLNVTKEKLNADQAQQKIDAATLAIEIGDEASGIQLLKDVIAKCDEFSIQKKAMALLNDLDSKVKK